MTVPVNGGPLCVPASEGLVEELLCSGLFDEAYYLSQLNGALNHPMGPAGHYAETGASQGLSPHPLFDPAFFLTHNSLERSNCLPPFLTYIRSTAIEAFQPHPLFDARFYLERHPDLLECADKINPLLHYVKHGAFERRNPNQYFNSEWYLKRKPHLRTNQINPLIDFVTSPADQICELDPFFDTATKNRYWTPAPAAAPRLGVEYATRAGLEILPWDRAFDEMLKLSAEPFSHVFILPGLIRGGGERAACSHIKHCQELHGIDNVLVILADYAQHSSIHWLPKETRLIEARRVLGAEYDPDDMAVLLTAFLLKTRPQVTHVINSFSAISALADYRDILRPCSEFIVYLFGYEEYTKNDFALLRIPVFQIAIGWVDCVITDTARLTLAIKQQIKGRLSPGKTTCQCYLASEHLTVILEKAQANESATRGAAKKILWASRLVQTKRPDLLAEIARKLPHIEFLAYGSSDTDLTNECAHFLELLRANSNITFGGAFSDFENIDFKDVAAFLYTSESDGIPWVLLEATAAGLPIVAPKVGGITEFLSEDSAWLIDQFNDVDAYAKAIEDLLSHHDLAHNKLINARTTLMHQHSAESFARQLRTLPKYSRESG